MPVEPHDDRPHPGAPAEEWLFACWAADGSVGAISGHRVLGRRAWYWAALVRPGEPLLHVTEWDVAVRAEPSVLKAHGLWAEHVCDAPLEQWTVANECYAAALDDPDDALGLAYGAPSAIAFDLEWYATAAAVALAAGEPAGFVQDGVVHGAVELPGERLELVEVPARRWHRWGARLAPVELAPAYAHTGLRAPFAFPDGTVADWVLSPDGWRSMPR